MKRLITSGIIAISLFISNVGMAGQGGGNGGGQQAQMANMTAAINVDTNIILTEDNVNSILSGEVFNSDISTALTIDSENNVEATQSRFSHSISSDATIMANGAELSEHAQVRLASHFLPEANDIGKTIEYIAVIHYQTDNEQGSWYFRSGEQWLPWHGDPQTLASAVQQTLSAVQEFTIFQGQLSNLQGKFMLYVGYRLNNGAIVYSAEPMNFSVQ